MVVVAFIGGVGGWEIVFVLAIALVVFGPKRLPQLARSLGKVSAQIRAANRQLQREIYENLDPDEIRRQDPARPPARHVEHGGEGAALPPDDASAASGEQEKAPEPGSGAEESKTSQGEEPRA